MTVGPGSRRARSRMPMRWADEKEPRNPRSSRLLRNKRGETIMSFKSTQYNVPSNPVPLSAFDGVPQLPCLVRRVIPWLDSSRRACMPVAALCRMENAAVLGAALQVIAVHQVQASTYGRHVC
jgi:hypothetical protein